MITRMTRIAALGATAALVLAGTAQARPGHRPFQATFPHAAHLCAQVARGHVPPKLKGDQEQVLAACGTLQTAFDGAVATVRTAEQAYRADVKAQRATRRQVCRTQPHDACVAARQAYRDAVKRDRETLRAAIKAYRASIESDRKTFWTTIAQLRGGAAITPDQPQPDAP